MKKKIILFSAIGLLVLAVAGIIVGIFSNSAPSNSYIKTFDLKIAKKNSLEYTFKKDIILDIVEVNQQNGNQGIATVKVTMPDINKVYQETIEKHKNESDSDDSIIMNELKENMQKHSISSELSLPVEKINSKWTVSDKSVIDNFINEQIDELLLNAFSLIEFTSFDVGGMAQ